MTRAPPRVWIFAFVAVVLLSLAVLFPMIIGTRAKPGPKRAEQRPKLLLLTSLPLVFNEDFTLSESGSPALTKLQSRYEVLPIGVTDQTELAKSHLLLMAQPPTQTAENLVVLDQWVRRGGHLLLLADPMLEWPSKLPLGDPLRPAPMFMDTGLIAHWGLRLDAPDRRGMVRGMVGGHQVMTVSPGRLSGDCSISQDRLIARCRIGQGKATIIADADFLDSNRLGSAGDHNLEALLEELARVGQS